MQAYIRPLCEGYFALRALMKSALPLLNNAVASQAVSSFRVWESRSDLSCHQLNGTSHRMVRYCNLLASPSPLWLSSFLPGQACAHSFCFPPPPPCPSPPWHVPTAVSLCSPHIPRLDSVQPTRSVHSYSPPLPRSDSTLDARATPGSTGCDYPFSSAPSAAWPGLHESAACAGTYLRAD